MKKKPKKLDLSKCLIRPAQMQDTNALLKMSQTIWDGHDYLPNILGRWIREEGFLVAEYEGMIVGCTKISRFPHDVIWFEGLRVHGRFQGMGLGNLLNQAAYEYARAEAALNPKLGFEFCTYYKNHESIHLAQKLGFRIVQKFYVITKRGVKNIRQPELAHSYDLAWFDCFDSHIPCGWQAVHRHPDSLPWMQARTKILASPRGRYLLGGISGYTIAPLMAPNLNIIEDLGYFQAFYGSYKAIELVLNMAWAPLVPALIQKGFRFWDDEPAPNMYIFTAH